MYNIKNYAVHIEVLTLALYYELILEKVRKVIEFNREA